MIGRCGVDKRDTTKLSFEQLQCEPRGQVRTFVIADTISLSFMKSHEDGRWIMVSRTLASEDLADVPSVVTSPLKAVR